jgi:ABC-type bacteriocin/lantibiotic exporter with double-glycine peptidase domain
MPVTISSLRFSFWLFSFFFATNRTLFASESSSFEDYQPVEFNRCGPIALVVCAKLNDVPLKFADIIRHFPTHDEYASLGEVQRAAEISGLHTLSLQWTATPPESPFVPYIAPIVNPDGRRHFIVVAARRGNRYRVIDMPNRPAWIDIDQLRTVLNWDGAALHVSSSGAKLDQLRSWLFWQQWMVPANVLLLIGNCWFAYLIMRPVRRRFSCPDDHS